MPLEAAAWHWADRRTRTLSALSWAVGGASPRSQRGSVAIVGADRGRLHAASLSADGLGQQGHLLAGVSLREPVRGTAGTVAASSHVRAAGGECERDSGCSREARRDVVPLCHV